MTPDWYVDTIIRLITNVGFPIFVALYLLIYQNRVIKDLQSAIESLTTAIGKMTQKG